MRILTPDDYQRMKSAVRKFQQMERIHQTRRRYPVGSGAGGGSILMPTGRKTIEPIYEGYSGDPLDVILTRDDRDKLIFWDGINNAVNYGDGGERIFWLPSDPKVGDVFWLNLVISATVHIRLTALNHSLTSYTVAYPYWENSDETPAEVGDYPNTRDRLLSHCFNWREGRWEREEITLYLQNGNPQQINTIVIAYTGEKSTYPIGYTDLDGDELFNAHPGDHEPLTYGDFYNWKILDMDLVTPGSPALNLWWTSIEGPYA